MVRRRRRRMVNPRDIAGNAKKKSIGQPQRYSWGGRRRRRMVDPEIWLGKQKKKKNGEPQRYSWEGRRRRRRMVSPRDIAGKAEEKEEW